MRKLHQPVEANVGSRIQDGVAAQGLQACGFVGSLCGDHGHRKPFGRVPNKPFGRVPKWPTMGYGDTIRAQS